MTERIRLLDVMNKLKEICTRYADEGLYIVVEIDMYGMVLRGVWNRPNMATKRFNRAYSYDTIRLVENESDLDFLVDEFKKEFEHGLKLRLKEHDA